MKTLKLNENLYYVGVIDHDLKVFDSIMPLKYGTSYNSYLLKTDEGAVLFEGSKAGFEDEYLNNIESICPLSEIKYLVVAHTEPDHSGAIEALLKKNTDITVVISPAGNNNLKNILRFPYKSMIMTAGKEMKVGQYTLSFVSGLFLHWPDVLFTYIKEEKALVTCDGFGAHYAFDDILYSKVRDQKEYREAFDYYFTCIMAPFANFVLDAVKRVRALDVKMLLVGHGPVIDMNAADVIDAFESDAKKALVTNDKNKITLVYTSCYGYTAEMAEYIEKKLKENGKEVDSYSIDALDYADKKDKILASIQSSSMVLFGSPTIINDAVPYFYDILLSQPNTFFANKKFSAFGDYGWSGEAVMNLSSFAQMRKMKVIDGYRYSFKLDSKCFEEMDEYVSRLIA